MRPEYTTTGVPGLYFHSFSQGNCNNPDFYGQTPKELRLRWEATAFMRSTIHFRILFDFQDNIYIIMKLDHQFIFFTRR